MGDVGPLGDPLIALALVLKRHAYGDALRALPNDLMTQKYHPFPGTRFFGAPERVYFVFSGGLGELGTDLGYADGPSIHVLTEVGVERGLDALHDGLGWNGVPCEDVDLGYATVNAAHDPAGSDVLKIGQDRLGLAWCPTHSRWKLQDVRTQLGLWARITSRVARSAGGYEPVVLWKVKAGASKLPRLNPCVL
jgi:hypothetical protein